ncbi:MAG: DNA polymerase III subunit delta' [Ruminococcus sp.]|jgi:DNA polymerase-3 subunit delta'|nr:DNA polymerase III subunit delta' [Ruminococcus sp.]
MNTPIFGNSALLSSLENMIASGRTANSVLFFGVKGSGRKTIARYYAKALLCYNPLPDGKPCNSCKSCRNFDDNVHPDFILPPKSGKLGGFSVDTAKLVCSDAIISPNNGDRKVYFFPDCHNMDVRTQNTLLKIIEEPPAFTFFIFTSLSKNDFLPTIISRCACFGVCECSENLCRDALTAKNLPQNDIDSAVSCFHGNIGRCLDYIFNPDIRLRVDLTKALTNSIINHDEYALAVNLFKLGKERYDVKDALSLLDSLLRDAAVILSSQQNSRSIPLIGCFPSGSASLASFLSARQIICIHLAVNKCWAAIEANSNISLTLSALSSDIAAICG